MSNGLTIADIENLRKVLTIQLAESLQNFEKEAGLRINYINIVRKRDRVGEADGGMPTPLSTTNGKIVAVNAELSLEVQ